MVDWNQLIYKSGDFLLPQPIKKVLDILLYKNYDYSFYVEVWHILHFVVGFLMGLVYIKSGYRYNTKIYLFNLFIIHTIWEYWQIYIGMSHPLRLTYHNNLIDILFDTFVFMLGSYLALVLV
jgi:hypothetical protein